MKKIYLYLISSIIILSTVIFISAISSPPEKIIWDPECYFSNFTSANHFHVVSAPPSNNFSNWNSLVVEQTPNYNLLYTLNAIDCVGSNCESGTFNLLNKTPSTHTLTSLDLIWSLNLTELGIDSIKAMTVSPNHTLWIINETKHLFEVNYTSGEILQNFSINDSQFGQIVGQTIEGITSNGTDFWIWDNSKFFFSDGDSYIHHFSYSGTRINDGFRLDTNGGCVLDITTDGNSLFLLPCSGDHVVWEYTLKGEFINSFNMGSNGYVISTPNVITPGDSLNLFVGTDSTAKTFTNYTREIIC